MSQANQVDIDVQTAIRRGRGVRVHRVIGVDPSGPLLEDRIDKAAALESGGASRLHQAILDLIRRQLRRILQHQGNNT